MFKSEGLAGAEALCFPDIHETDVLRDAVDGLSRYAAVDRQSRALEVELGEYEGKPVWVSLSTQEYADGSTVAIGTVIWGKDGDAAVVVLGDKFFDGQKDEEFLSIRRAVSTLAAQDVRAASKKWTERIAYILDAGLHAQGKELIVDLIDSAPRTIINGEKRLTEMSLSKREIGGKLVHTYWQRNDVSGEIDQCRIAVIEPLEQGTDVFVYERLTGGESLDMEWRDIAPTPLEFIQQLDARTFAKTKGFLDGKAEPGVEQDVVTGEMVDEFTALIDEIEQDLYGR